MNTIVNQLFSWFPRRVDIKWQSMETKTGGTRNRSERVQNGKEKGVSFVINCRILYIVKEGV